MTVTKPLLLSSHYEVFSCRGMWWRRPTALGLQVKVKYLIEHTLLLHWSQQQIKFNLSWSCLSSHTEQSDTWRDLGFKSCLFKARSDFYAQWNGNKIVASGPLGISVIVSTTLLLLTIANELSESKIVMAEGITRVYNAFIYRTL